MQLGIFGYGKMGRAVERIANERGHVIRVLSDTGNDLENGDLDCVIDFTDAAVAPGILRKCIDSGIPVVSGTTGWTPLLPEVQAYCRSHSGAMIWAPNFSVGMYITFAINRLLALMMEKRAEYNPSLVETHHTEKRDAPSGTAIALAEQIIETLSRKQGWTLADDPSSVSDDSLAIRARRTADVKGQHRVSYQGPHDIISLEHEALSRDGFALGAVIAAEWLARRTGVYTFDDVLSDLFRG